MKRVFCYLCSLIGVMTLPSIADAQIVLIGDNAPYGIINDGDFTTLRANWRAKIQPPFWKCMSVRNGGFSGDAQMGIHMGTLFCGSNEGVADSKLLDTNELYQKPMVGDKYLWEFGADLEYISKGYISLSIMFGDKERIVANKMPLKGSDVTMEHFKGEYIVTKEDVKEGLPHLRLHFYSTNGIKIFVDYVNLSVERGNYIKPQLKSKVTENSIILTWDDKAKAERSSDYTLHRLDAPTAKYKALGTFADKFTFADKAFIYGQEYTYVVTYSDKNGAEIKSNILQARCTDKVAPAAPITFKPTIYDSEIRLNWQKSADKDIAYYSVYRGNEDGTDMNLMETNLPRNFYEDIDPMKGVVNLYRIYAHDKSGNRSVASADIKAKSRLVRGASFSDLILPMPVGKGLRSDVWGASNVLPRDPENGIEDEQWTYWGGTPVYDQGKYHINVTRWREDAVKGHWEWPFSKVAYAVSDNPIGPYKVKREHSYDYHNGMGHNPDIIKMQDGSFVLYSLIDWKACLFTSKRMEGPWKYLGEMEVDFDSPFFNKKSPYLYSRNLSGVQLEDKSILIVSKGGAMIKSDKGLLGPYKIITDAAAKNKTLPERYQKYIYEDPVMWRDDVQFHFIINAFINKKAIYFRSPDGINWQYDPGVAYTKYYTTYENGERILWDKLERPHVIQDKYGRASHLSLAVIDVDKDLDFGSDGHSAKNMIIPLRVNRRLVMMNKDVVTAETKEITIEILSEEGFDAAKSIDLESLRFGASDEVNYGRGAKATKSKATKRGLMVSFDGAGNGITEKDFVCKLIGRDKSGELVVGYSKMQRE